MLIRTAPTISGIIERVACIWYIQIYNIFSEKYTSILQIYESKDKKCYQWSIFVFWALNSYICSHVKIELKTDFVFKSHRIC